MDHYTVHDLLIIINSIMPKKIISVDVTKAPWEQETPLHNRLHPEKSSVSSALIGLVVKSRMMTALMT